MTLGVSVTWENGDEAVYGPFRDMSSAYSWIENDLPEDDEIVRSEPVYVPKGIPLNDPLSIEGDIPDSDIRDDTFEDIVKERGYLPD